MYNIIANYILLSLIIFYRLSVLVRKNLIFFIRKTTSTRNVCHYRFIKFIYTLEVQRAFTPWKSHEMVNPYRIILTVSITTVQDIRAILLARLLPLSRNPVATAESLLNTLNVKHFVVHTWSVHSVARI